MDPNVLAILTWASRGQRLRDILTVWDNLVHITLNPCTKTWKATEKKHYTSLMQHRALRIFPFYVLSPAQRYKFMYVANTSKWKSTNTQKRERVHFPVLACFLHRPCRSTWQANAPADEVRHLQHSRSSLLFQINANSQMYCDQC